MLALDPSFTVRDPAYWAQLARHEHLVVMIAIERARLEAAIEAAAVSASVIRQLSLAGVRVVIRSDHRRADAEQLVAAAPDAWWFVESGEQRWRAGTWLEVTDGSPELRALASRLASCAPRLRMALTGASLTMRGLESSEHARDLDEAVRACDRWLAEHPHWELETDGEILEIRRLAHRDTALRDVRAAVPGARVLAITDDGQLLAELADGDTGVAIGESARARLTTFEPLEILRWLLDARRGVAAGPPPVAPVLHPRPAGARRLVVMTHRMPQQDRARMRSADELAAALVGTLRDRGGIWLGWSGACCAQRRLIIEPFTAPPRAMFDLSPASHDRLHAEFCSRVLWPVFHGYTATVNLENGSWNAYVAINRRYAQHATELARPDAVIWAHDYHLLLAAQALRAVGHRGRTGLFLRVPFPDLELFDRFPWRDPIVEAMTEFELIGFTDRRSAANFIAAARSVGGVEHAGVVRRSGHATSVAVFPIHASADPGTGRTGAFAWATGFLEQLSPGSS